MDLSQIATAAAALIAPYLADAGKGAAKKAGEAAWQKACTLYQFIERKFSRDGDDYARTTLQRLEAQPADARRQAVLADLLAEKASQDPAFGDELKGLVQELAYDHTVSEFLTQVYDQAQVGKIVNFRQAGTVNID